MIGINQVFFYGRLAAEPENKELPGGKLVSRLLLVNERKYSTADGEEKSESCFIRVSLWDKKAELCAKTLRKGARVIITGRLYNDNYTSADGVNKSELRINVSDIRFIDYAPDADFREAAAE